MDPDGADDGDDGRSSPVITTRLINTRSYRESSSGRSSPILGAYSSGSRFVSGGGGSGRSSPIHNQVNYRIQSGAYNPTPVASINAMPYPFSSMRTPQRLLIPTSTVLDSTRPHACRTPKSKQALNLELDAVSDDEDCTYMPAAYKIPPSRKVCNYIDDIVNSPEMEQVEEETKKIRRDAEAVLKRLHTPRLSGTREFNSYDYSNIYRVPPPVPAAAHNYATNEDYDDEDRFAPLRTRPRQPLSQYLFATRDTSPDHVANTRFQCESTRKALYSTPSVYSRSSYSTGQSLTRSASFTPSSSSSSYSSSRGSTYHPDVDSVKNNIAARARYASTRAAAEAGIRKKNEYLMI